MSLVYAINAGGGAYTAASGELFEADFGFTGGTASQASAGVSGTEDPQLYNTQRWGNFVYGLPVTNDVYDVEIMMAETYSGAFSNGARVFSMTAEDDVIFTELDLFATAGANTAITYTAHDVEVTDGQLNIRTQTVADNPTIAAIRVLSATGAADPGGEFGETPQVVTYPVYPYNVTGEKGCGSSVSGYCSTFESGVGGASGSAQVDSSRGYMSSSSLRVSGSQFMQVTAPADRFWMRAFLYSDGPFAKGHGTFFYALGDDGQQLRVGDHRCQLEINRDGGSKGGGDYEMTSGSYGEDATVCNEEFGARMEPGTWYCLEAYFGGPDSEIQVFWDNQNVEQLHVTEDRIATNADKRGGQWASFASIPWGPHNLGGNNVYFGYTNYHGDYARTLWFDDVALAGERIGCGADYTIKAPLQPSTRYPGYQQEEGLPEPVVQ